MQAEDTSTTNTSNINNNNTNNNTNTNNSLNNSINTTDTNNSEDNIILKNNSNKDTNTNTPNTPNIPNTINNQTTNTIKLFIKSIHNKIVEVQLNHSIPITDSKTQAFQALDLNPDKHIIKFIYSGKILDQTKTLSDYGVKELDVLLYIVRDKEKIEESSNQINENLSSASNTNETGLDRFRALLGASPQEIYMLRVLFHSAYIRNNRSSNISHADLVSREEDWYNQQNPNSLANLGSIVGNFNGENAVDGVEAASNASNGSNIHNNENENAQNNRELAMLSIFGNSGNRRLLRLSQLNDESNQEASILNVRVSKL